MATRNQNIWIPFADNMTALMLIFLLIVVLIFSIIRQKDLAREMQLVEYQTVLDNLYRNLHNITADKRDEWDTRMLENLAKNLEELDISLDQDNVIITDLEARQIILDDIYKDLQNTFVDKRDEWDTRMLENLAKDLEELNISLDQDNVIITDLETHQIILDDIYKDLQDAFANKRDEWGIRVFEDLTIRFENPDILFDRDSAIIKDEFKSILDEFVSLYLSIVNKKDYEGKIKEIKVEGHTAGISPIHNTYIKTIRLSQDRARGILEYIRETRYFEKLGQTEKEKITFLLSANGFGNSRAVDAANRFVYDTKERISPNSRRVEFKIVTNSDELVQKLIEEQ